MRVDNTPRQLRELSTKYAFSESVSHHVNSRVVDGLDFATSDSVVKEEHSSHTEDETKQKAV